MGYDENFVITRIGPTFFDLYAQAGRLFGDDPNSCVWPCRTQADIDTGMNPESSLSKHAEECRVALGLPPTEPTIPPPQPGTGIAGTLRASGKYFVNDSGNYFPLFASCLYALADGRDLGRAALDQLVQLGFGGVRVFAGHLEGRGQTAASARANLPTFMAEAKVRGLYVQVAAITDSAEDDYDVREHVREVASIVAPYGNGIICLANEYWHSTQSELVHDADYLREIGEDEVEPKDVLWAVGAADIDELDVDNGIYPGYGGTFNQVHLERRTSSTYPWYQEACRVREQESVQSKHNAPVMNGEPNKSLGTTPFYFTLGILSRGFNLGIVLHTEDGLQARPLGADLPQAEYLLRAVRLVPHTRTFQFYNARWDGSPVKTARFVDPVEGDPDGKTVWRVYSYVLSDDTGIVVAVGPDPDNAGIVWQNGWSQVGVLDKVANTNVLAIARS